MLARGSDPPRATLLSISPSRGWSKRARALSTRLGKSLAAARYRSVSQVHCSETSRRANWRAATDPVAATARMKTCTEPSHAIRASAKPSDP